MVVRALPVHRPGGLELHTRDLVTALSERGHELFVVTSASPRDGAADPCPMPESVHVSCLPIGTPGDYSVPFFAGIGTYTSHLCQRVGGVDILHTQEFAGTFMRYPVPRAAGAYVSTVHGTMFSETELDPSYLLRSAPWKWPAALLHNTARLALAPFYRYGGLARPDLLITDSEFTRARLGAPFADKTRVVPLGIDFSRYDIPQDGLPPAVQVTDQTEFVPLTVAVLGRMQEMKGTPDVLEAARLMRERNIPIRIRIAGAGKEAGDLRARVSRDGLESSVEVLGRLPAAQVSPFLRAADIFLFPDRTQPAFGLVAVEAMAHGLPVIGTRRGAIPEVVRDGENGWLVDARKPRQIADLLCRLSTPDGRAEVMARGQGAHRSVKFYKARLMAERVENVYEEALSKKVAKI